MSSESENEEEFEDEMEENSLSSASTTSSDDGPTFVAGMDKTQSYHISADVARPELDDVEAQGYFPLQWRYDKLIHCASELEKTELGYLEYGKTVEVYFPSAETPKDKYAIGKIVSHQKCWRNNKKTGGTVHYAANDTCDVRMPDGTRLLDVGIKEIKPVQIFLFPLLCGYTAEDGCLFFTCICFTFALFALIFSILMYASADTKEFSTALWAYFYMTFVVISCLVLSVFFYRLERAIGTNEHRHDENGDSEESDASYSSESESDKEYEEGEL